MEAIPLNLYIRSIQKSDSVKSFSLGKKEHSALKTFLIKDACEFHNLDLAKTYVLVDDSAKVWAYMTLICSQISLEPSQRPIESKRAKSYKAFPAIKLARLAVHSKLHKNGHGRKLLSFAIALIKEKIMPYAGCRFFIVDSKQDAIAFYKKAGFILLDDEKNIKSDTPLLFIDMLKI